MTPDRIAGDRRGFVLALVVLMMFAISMMAGAGYLIVNSESRMARYAAQGEEALAIARGGLHRFTAEQLGVVADSARYAIGAGEALVTARRVSVIDSHNDMYYLRSEATIVDPGSPQSPAQRVVGAYAYHRRQPLPLYAAAVLSVEEFEIHSSAQVVGTDIGALFCPGGAAPTIAGAIARDLVDANGVLLGTPPSALWPGGHTQFMTQMGIRWDVLTDPSFAVDFEDVTPDFGALPADSFPVVRINGNLNASPAWNGRGVLVVRDQFDAINGFDWDGIILAGWVDDEIRGNIEGMLVGGFSGTDPYPRVQTRADIRYHSCNVSRANESLSYLDLIDHTVFEVR